ncbi:SDR family NAD(P)-dependent oxidoreductase [Leucobacter sp. HY1910]
MKLAGTSVVVTGAASGLGAAVSSAFAARGAHVLGIDLEVSIERARGQGASSGANSDTGSRIEVARPGGAPAGSVRLVAADVTSGEEVAAALATLDSAQPLRVAVNCAGIAPSNRILGRDGPHDLDLFRRIVDVNLVGTFNVLRLAAEIMAKQEPTGGSQAGSTGGEGEQRGVIVNTASIAAYEGQIGQSAYAASKGAIVSLTLTAARDLARNGIRVNTIAPGVVNTPMLAGLGAELGEALAAEVPFPPRLAQPTEFAKLVMMIVDHDYLNGETIRMDGALRMGPR